MRLSEIIYAIKHPIEYWKLLQIRKRPVVNLDNPENNCSFCGYDHHSSERFEKSVKELKKINT